LREIAIVVQRFGKEILGGAETLSRVFAMALNSNYKVTILTSTAQDYVYWHRFYPPGESDEGGLKIIRFHPDFERTTYFHELNRIFQSGIQPANFSGLGNEQKRCWQKHVSQLPLAFQEELIKWQGPYCTNLFNYLRKNSTLYDAIVFFTYLYPTTYFGIEQVEVPERVFICPTLHDEAHAYLSIWNRYRDYKLLFLTDEEMQLARGLWGKINGAIIGYGIADIGEVNLLPPSDDEPYLLYAGRIDSMKGISTLLDYFTRYKEENPEQPVKLKLIGRAVIDLKSDKKHGIEYLGFVNEERKFQIMTGALALAIPSSYESLSIVALEALMVRTPILVNGNCAVLAGLVKRSEAGFAYSGYSDFKIALSSLLNDRELKRDLGQRGRLYFCENYEWSTYQQKVFKGLRLEE